MNGEWIAVCTNRSLKTEKKDMSGLGTIILGEEKLKWISRPGP